MKQYLDLCKYVLKQGKPRKDRTGTGTISTFGYQARYDLEEGFPLLTTKKLNWNNIVYELLWFLRGDSNITYLHEHNVHIWDEWANEEGNLGPIYGKQWRSWKCYGGIAIRDQILEAIKEIRENPTSRRIIVSAWNVDDLDRMALPPCHLLFQFYVHEGKLSCQLYQRSADIFLGVPYNIASYSLLTHIIARYCDLEVGEFIHTIGDAHIYTNHLEQIGMQLCREPYPLPKVYVKPEVKEKYIGDLTMKDIILEKYKAHPHIKGKVSV
jgi:thymidylate synthase